LPQVSLSRPVLRHAFPAEGKPALSQASVKHADIKTLSGLNVLLVEDQTLIALDTETMLLELGAAKVDTFMASDEAMAWLASGSPDVGVLDINLGAASSFPIAEELRRRLIPFVFTTGYGDAMMIPSEFVEVGVVHKPYTRDALQESLSKCLGIHPPGD